MLVLLPTRTEKLLAKWNGPYKVLRKVGRVNYEVEVPGGRKEKKLFHVNMLKPWTNPEENFVESYSGRTRRTTLLRDAFGRVDCHEVVRTKAQGDSY